MSAGAKPTPRPVYENRPRYEPARPKNLTRHSGQSVSRSKLQDCFRPGGTAAIQAGGLMERLADLGS